MNRKRWIGVMVMLAVFVCYTGALAEMDTQLSSNAAWTDVNENITDREQEASIPADEAQYALAQFDIDGFRQRFEVMEEVVLPASMGCASLAGQWPLGWI